MGNSLPPVPDYHSAAVTLPPSTPSKNPNDIWGLGDVYDQPVYLGTTSAKKPVIYSGSGDLKIGAAASTQTTTQDSFGTTQDIMQSVMKLWAQQQAERAKKPGALTGYEALQQQLYAAGFYGQTAFKKIHVGQWTTQTQDAVVKALASYEQARAGGSLPVTFTEFLSGNAAQNSDGGFYSDQGAGPAPTQVALADPASIRQAAQSAAMDALGQGLSDAQLDKFVSQFQAAQTAAQTSKAASVTGPDLSSDAMAFAQQSNPGAYKDNQRSAYLGALVNLFGGTRPNVTPVAPVGK